MPPPITEDAESDVDVFDVVARKVDTEAKRQLNGELKDKIDEDEDEDEDEPELVPSAAEDDDEEDVEAKGKGEADDGDEQEAEGAEYIVEAIRDHQWLKGVLLYEVKWKGWPEGENTMEPVDHLLPHSRQILANYTKKIGGTPQPPIKKGKSKQSLREAASTEDLPASKRQKRNGTDQSEEVGTWLPKGHDWEDQVNKVETIERNEDTNQLMAYIQFKNGKRSKITMDMVYQHCPRPMLKFYEANLKFNQ